MIPDRLQYFLDDFWNDQKFTKSGPSDPVFITKILQNYSRSFASAKGRFRQLWVCWLLACWPAVVWLWLDGSRLADSPIGLCSVGMIGRLGRVLDQNRCFFGCWFSCDF